MNSEPLNAVAETPVFRSRREMRAAGAYDATPDAAGPLASAAPSSAGLPLLVEPPVVTPADGIASLFPLLADMGSAPVETTPAALLAARPTAPADAAVSRFAPEASVAPAAVAPATVSSATVSPAPHIEATPTESTLAMPVAEIEAELATPVPPLVVHQEPIAPIVAAPAPVRPVSTVPPTVPPVPAPSAPVARAAEQLDVAAVFGLAPTAGQAPAAAPTAAPALASSRRDLRVEPAAAPRGRQPRQKRVKRPRTATNTAARRPESSGKSARQRVTGLGVMVLVGGLFAVLALPAYADNDASSLAAASKVSTQKLAVSAAAATQTTATVSRDGYTATSAADLKKLYSDAIRQRNLAAYMQSGAKAQGDDYPWFAELSRNQGGGLSPLNYYYRECVDFVAWRLNRDAGSTHAPFKWVWSNLTPSGGNASQWKSAWLNHGWATGTTPKVGAVAWFPYNHVAYVSGILNDGSVAVEEYNWQGQHLYGTRIIQPGDAYYLYAPPA